MKRFLCNLLVLGWLSVPAGARILNVPRVTWNDPDGTEITFTQRVILHADVHRGNRYEVRFLRGTKTSLKGAITAFTMNGCVIIPGTVFTATVDNGIIDVGFPHFTTGWVESDAGERTDEAYVVVLERIDTPDDHALINLAPSFAPKYIDRGLQVTLKAPPALATSAPSRVWQFFASVFSVFTTTAAASPAPVTPVPVRPPPPPPTPRSDCLNFP